VCATLLAKVSADIARLGDKVIPVSWCVFTERRCSRQTLLRILSHVRQARECGHSRQAGRQHARWPMAAACRAGAQFDTPTPEGCAILDSCPHVERRYSTSYRAAVSGGPENPEVLRSAMHDLS